MVLNLYLLEKVRSHSRQTNIPHACQRAVDGAGHWRRLVRSTMLTMATILLLRLRKNVIRSICRTTLMVSKRYVSLGILDVFRQHRLLTHGDRRRSTRRLMCVAASNQGRTERVFEFVSKLPRQRSKDSVYTQHMK